MMIKDKIVNFVQKNQTKEWLFAIVILVFCALISRFFIKDKVALEDYQAISFAFWGVCTCVLMPIFKYFLRFKVRSNKNERIDY